MAAALLSAAAPTVAQAPLALDVVGGAPRLQVGAVLDDDALEQALRSGLPLRMQFRIELWRDQFFDELVDQAQWTRVVAYEPLEELYLLGEPGDSALESFSSWEELRRVVERAYRPSITAPAEGRYYYIGVLDMETLSLSDLDELERWLRGELEPAVRGRQSVGGALGNGLKRLLIRVLGLPARHYEARSGPFVAP
jgi:hypothetical protein